MSHGRSNVYKFWVYLQYRAAYFLVAAVFWLATSNSSFALDAFPGAAGHGSQSEGGRGGEIIFVTNLDDSGPGSLRACVEETMKRNCVFRVGGIIHLKKPIGIRADNGNLSLLGQTAPGSGIDRKSVV